MLLTVSQMQEVEKAAFACDVKAVDLMEQAGKGIAEGVQQFFPTPGRCVLYCGKGNNAGDVLVAGRFLAKAGWKISIRAAFPEEEMSELTQQQMQCLKKKLSAADFHLGKKGVISKLSTNTEKKTSSNEVSTSQFADAVANCGTDPLARAAYFSEKFEKRQKEGPLILIDGLLGIGAQGEPRGEIKVLIEELNARRWREGAFVVAADLPSGLDATTGVPSKSCVEADLTVTIAYGKTGLVADVATNKVGRLAVMPLCDLKTTEGDEASLITSESLRTLLPPRSFDVHKGMFGHVGIIAGSRGYLGAAQLASAASVHAGVGLVTLFALPETYELLATSVLPEVMVKPITSYTDVLAERLDVLAIGPGLGAQHRPEILEIIEKASMPCVVDADALNALAHEMSRLLKAQGPRLLTPHPGEMERLFPCQNRTRAAWASNFVEKYPVTLLLKGARTIIAEKEKAIAYNTTGNPGMASGGMGDVLTGVVAAFLASGHQSCAAATLGAWLCGHAAEIAIFQGTASQESLAASDVIDNLGRAMKSLRARVF